MKIIRITASFLFLMLAFLPLLGFASSDSHIVNYKLNGKEERVKFNSSVAGDKISIEINANVPVKFNTIALCSSNDNVCNRATAVKYFTKTDAFVPSVSKEWDGKTSKGAVVTKGDYKIKVTMKDADGIEKIQELKPYLISVDSLVFNVSNVSDSKSSPVSGSLSSQSQSSSSFATASQSNLDNDPVVKKIRDFIANGNRKSGGVEITENIAVEKSPSLQNAKSPSDNSVKPNAAKFKKIKQEKEETISTSTNQVAEIVLSEDSNHESFIWKILNLPFSGFNLIKRLFYSGN